MTRRGEAPKLFNLKINELRKHGYRDVEDWLSRPGHIYIGRMQKVFIYTNIDTNEWPGTRVAWDSKKQGKILIRPNDCPDKIRNSNVYCQTLLSFPVGSYVHTNNKIVKWYNIPESKWHNPFRSKQMGLNNSLEQFEEYLSKNKTLLHSLREFDDAVAIGCWCAPNPCHGKVILDWYKKYKEIEYAKQREQFKILTSTSTSTTTSIPTHSYPQSHTHLHAHEHTQTHPRTYTKPHANAPSPSSSTSTSTSFSSSIPNFTPTPTSIATSTFNPIPTRNYNQNHNYNYNYQPPNSNQNIKYQNQNQNFNHPKSRQSKMTDFVEKKKK